MSLKRDDFRRPALSAAAALADALAEPASVETLRERARNLRRECVAADIAVMRAEGRQPSAPEIASRVRLEAMDQIAGGAPRMGS